MREEQVVLLGWEKGSSRVKPPRVLQRCTYELQYKEVKLTCTYYSSSHIINSNQSSEPGSSYSRWANIPCHLQVFVTMQSVESRVKPIFLSEHHTSRVLLADSREAQGAQHFRLIALPFRTFVYAWVNPRSRSQLEPLAQ